VAYETLPRNIRGELHRRAAEVVTRAEDRARHLDRAAEYLSDNVAVRAEAAAALAGLGEDLARQSRLRDAARVLERAVSLGARRPSTLLELARVYDASGHDEKALPTLALIEDSPDDPTLAIERDHAMARAKIFSDPAWAQPRLRQVSTRWQDAGDEVRAAWAIANAGVASFNMSRMEEAAADLNEALAIFERLGERAGAVSASSFLCLVKPTDRRVPVWLAGALAFADEAGDRMKQASALSALAWHHFLRSMWGGPAETVFAEQLALRLAELAEDVGAVEFAIHSWSLLAVMARMSGRVRLAATHVAALARHLGPEQHEPWLGWAASFAVAVAEGAHSAAPPFPPATSPDPVAGVAGLVVQAELLLAGRCAEALAHFQEFAAMERKPANTLSDAMGVLCALGLVLSGRGDEAGPWAERAIGAARVLQARPTEVAARAVLTEISGDPTGLPEPPAVASSVAEALVLRAHAALGNEAAREALRRAAESLVAPGLLAGI
jgi:tetratricopeptide (TPR) repeat protein